MGLRVVLIDQDGYPQLLDDPAGGTFNAAGDFDRLLGSDDELPIWSLLFPETEWTFGADEVRELLGELDVLQGRALPGPESRGLARLRRLAQAALADPSLTLEAEGD